MNTYVPVRKIFKVVSTHRIPKHERHSSLQECLDVSMETRRRRCRWKSWIILFLFSSILVYVYTRRSYLFSQMNEHIVVNKISLYSAEEDQISIPAADSLSPPRPTYLSLATELIGTPREYTKKDTLDAEIEVQEGSQDMPFCLLKKPYATVVMNMTISVNISLDNVHPLVKKGGYYRPTGCRARHRVAIIVPYRDREHNLGIFLYNIHPFLMQQKLEYQIFVIEQYGKELFNKGRLLNAGFREMMKFNTFHCVILHDLDLLPTNENILYTCPTLPRHMCATVNDSDIKIDYNISYKFKSLFGGVIAMSIEQFERANGFSNLYFGWGGEDNDMFWRLRAAGYPLVRYSKMVGQYIVLPHIREPANPFRHHLLSRAVERYKIDGLSNIEYYVMSTKFHHLCTHIVVDINPREDNITELNNKWGHSFYKF